MSEPPRILLEHRLKTLKLSTFLRGYEKVARQSAHEGPLCVVPKNRWHVGVPLVLPKW